LFLLFAALLGEFGRIVLISKELFLLFSLLLLAFLLSELLLLLDLYRTVTRLGPFYEKRFDDLGRNTRYLPFRPLLCVSAPHLFV